MRPIDADELQKQISSRFFATNYYSDFYKLVDSMPTVEQKHGHWRVDEISGNIECSYCYSSDERLYGFCNSNDFEYCPWCGAKMDEVTEE